MAALRSFIVDQGSVLRAGLGNNPHGLNTYSVKYSQTTQHGQRPPTGYASSHSSQQSNKQSDHAWISAAGYFVLVGGAAGGGGGGGLDYT